MTSVAVQPDSASPAALVLDGLLPLCTDALPAAERLLEIARTSVLAIVAPAGGKIDADLLEANQTAAHGYAWMATYVEGLRQILGWAGRLEAAGELGELESLIVQAAYGEYLAQLTGGISLSQVEIVRPGDLGMPAEALAAFRTPAVATLIERGAATPVRLRIAELVAENHSFGKLALEDETLDMVRDQFTRFAEDMVVPHAHGWHE